MENTNEVEVSIQESNLRSKSVETRINEPQRFSSEDILIFTSNFGTKIGADAVEDIYKGQFANGLHVAVKVFSASVVDEMFMGEVQMLSRIYHRNLTRLYGFCLEKHLKALVYEYSNNGSLDSLLNQKGGVKCAEFYDIAIEMARGIGYLHEEMYNQVVHCNLNPTNVFLDKNLSVKIVMSGAQMVIKNKNHHISQHYTSPEMFSATSHVTSKCDIYSFGMILFEIVRTIADGKGNSWFPEIAWDEFEKMDKRRARILSMVALWCVQFTPETRPSALTVLKVLQTEIHVNTPPNPFLPTDPLKSIMQPLPFLPTDPLKSIMQPLEESKEIFSSRVDLPQKLKSMSIQRSNANFYSVTMLMRELVFEKAKRYSFDELVTFTSNFDDRIGFGAFGDVYRGQFSDETEIAVKVLKMNDFVQHSFLTEIRTLGKTDHPNLVKLFGFCLAENMLALVYEYMEHGSLDKVLYKKTLTIEWDKLYAIAVEIATALAYLHHDCRDEIIHHDIKAANVLLDSNLSPKLADFGLANLKDRDRTHLTMSKAKGTPGYAAPEIWRPFVPITSKCDVYGFGMILFEILGKESNSREDFWFPDHAWEQFNNGKFDDVLMECAISEKDMKKAMVLSMVALWCAQYSPGARPSMSMVVEVLHNEILVNRPPDPSMQSKLSMKPAENS